MAVGKAAMLRSQGFSLIELLLVILIIGLGVGLASLNVNTSNRAIELTEDAENFASLASLIMDEAVLSGQPWGIEFYRDTEPGSELYGYRWLKYSKAQGWRPDAPVGMEIENVFSMGTEPELELEGAVVVINDKKTVVYEDDSEQQDAADEDQRQEQQDKQLTDAERSANKKKNALKPNVWMLPGREVSPFILTLRDRQESDLFQVVRADLLGRFKLDDEDDEDS